MKPPNRNITPVELHINFYYDFILNHHHHHHHNHHHHRRRSSSSSSRSSHCHRRHCRRYHHHYQQQLQHHHNHNHIIAIIIFAATSISIRYHYCRHPACVQMICGDLAKPCDSHSVRSEIYVTRRTISYYTMISCFGTWPAKVTQYR